MTASSTADGASAGGGPPTGTASAPAGLADAEAIRDAVLSRPDVAGLSAGALGEVASYFAGRRVPGVRASADGVEVHVVAAYGRALREIADDIGAALAPLLAGRSLQVVISDILLPGETLDAADGGEGGEGG